MRLNTFRFLPTRRAFWGVALGLAFGASAWSVTPEQDLVGEWSITLDYQGNQIPAKLIFTLENGVVVGKWSSERGETPLGSISLAEDGVIKFTRSISFQDQQFELNYEGKIENNKLSGKFTTPMGDLPAAGERTKAPEPPAPAPAVEAAPAPAADNSILAGDWEIVVDSPLGVNTRKLSFDANLQGTYTADYGTFKTSNTKLEGDKLSFDLTLEMDGQTLSLAFTGTVADGKLKGEMLSDAGTATVEGKRLGGASSETAAAPAAGGPLGEWALSIESPDGATYDGVMTITNADGKNSGKLVTDLGEVVIPSININGDAVDFATEIDFGGTMVPVKFNGKVEGGQLKGEVSINLEGQEMNMPVVGTQKGAAVAAAPAAAPAGGALGEWALSIESPDGATYDGVMTITNADGKNSGKLVTDLGEVVIPSINLNGDAVDFATEIDFGGTMVPVKFNGKIEEGKLKGEVVINMEGQEMALPVVGTQKGAAVAEAPAAPAGGVLGEWALSMESPDGATYDGVMTFSETDGKASGKLVTDLGEVAIPSVNINGGAVDFATEIDFGGTAVPVKFNGKVEEGKLKGEVVINLEGQEMTLPVVGTQKGAAVAEAPAPAPAAPAGGVLGEWALSIESPDGATYDGVMTIAEAEGKTSGKLVTDLGEVVIPSINVNGAAVDFATEIDFGGTMVPVKFNGKVEEGKLKGDVSINLEGQEMNLPVVGTQKGAAVAEAPAPAPAAGGPFGEWALSIESPDGATYDGVMTIAQADGKNTGKLVTDLGEVVIPSININGEAVDFATEIDFGGTMVPVKFNGKIAGGELKGEVGINLEGQEMNLPVSGKLKGEAAVAAPAAPAAGGVFGEWALSIESPDGATYDGVMNITQADGKTTGKLVTDLGEVVIPAINVNEDAVDFATEIDFGGTMVPVKFNGKLEGDKLKGEVSINLEGQEMALPVVGSKKGAEAAAAPAGDYTGVWTLDITSPDGAAYSGELTVKETEGKTVGTLVTDLGEVQIPDIKREGEGVNFKVEVDFGGTMVPIGFTGKINAAGEIEGTVSLDFQGSAMEMPVKGKRKAEGAASEALTGEVSLPGGWTLEVETPEGATSNVEFTVTADGANLSGKLVSELGEAAVKEIKVEGNNVSFSAEIDMGGSAVPLSFSGSTGGDQIKGKVKINLDGQDLELPLVGKKTKAPEAAAPAPAESAEVKPCCKTNSACCPDSPCCKA